MILLNFGTIGGPGLANHKCRILETCILRLRVCTEPPNWQDDIRSGYGTVSQSPPPLEDESSHPAREPKPETRAVGLSSYH